MVFSICMIIVILPLNLPFQEVFEDELANWNRSKQKVPESCEFRSIIRLIKRLVQFRICFPFRVTNLQAPITLLNPIIPVRNTFVRKYIFCYGCPVQVQPVNKLLIPNFLSIHPLISLPQLHLVYQRQREYGIVFDKNN